MAFLFLVNAEVSAQRPPKPAPNPNKAANREKFKNMTPEQRADAAATRMTKRYGLNADQTAKAKTANLAFVQCRQANKAAKAAGTLNKDNRQKCQDEHKASLKGVFTPEQYTKWEADLQAAKARRQAHRGGKHPGKGKGAKGGNDKGASPNPTDKSDAGDNEDDVYEILDDM